MCLKLKRPGGGPSFTTSAWLTGQVSSPLEAEFPHQKMGIVIGLRELLGGSDEVIPSTVPGT